MTFSNDVLRYDERVVFTLRSLYSKFGYKPYRVNKFEEYRLYAENKAFLASSNIITFTGIGGKLMALRPDVTLSIVKNIKDDKQPQKLYYDEKVYRPMGPGLDFKERTQAGLEFIGELDIDSIGEVIMLARRSLDVLGERNCLDISHMGYICGLFDGTELLPSQRSQLLRTVSQKNVHELLSLCDKFKLPGSLCENLTELTALYGPMGTALGKLERINSGGKCGEAIDELFALYEVLQKLNATENINLDFSIVNDMRYYNGIIFQGYIEGIPSKVLSGGRYDELLRKFAKRADAIGFAVYLDLLELFADEKGAQI